MVPMVATLVVLASALVFLGMLRSLDAERRAHELARLLHPYRVR